MMFSWFAERRRHAELVKMKVETGNQLRDAALNGRFSIVAQIVRDYGNDPEIINSIYLETPWFGPVVQTGTALNQAAWAGEAEIVKELLKAPVVVVNTPDPQYWLCTPLLEAAKRGHTEVVSVLAARPEVLVNKRKLPSQTTALMFAVLHCPDALPDLLRRPDLDVNSVTRFGCTALHLACMKTDVIDMLPKCVDDLLSLRGDVELDAQDCYQNTALMYAAKNGNNFVVNRLLQAGANPILRCKDGRTAAKIAEEHGQIETARMIEGAALEWARMHLPTLNVSM